MAQIYPDPNWRDALIEDFDEPISYWEWHQGDFSNSNYRWKAYLGSTIAPPTLFHVYQPNNAIYDSINGMMRLVCEYDFFDSIPAHKFPIPNNTNYDSLVLGNKLYFSGAIEYVKNNLTATRVDLGVFDNNPKARKCYESVGFKVYGSHMIDTPFGEWSCTDLELFV